MNEFITKIAGKKWDTRHIYNPNSVTHRMRKAAFGGPSIKSETILRLELERLRDFVAFLFDHSEHCDHISHSDAWQEFEIYESKTSMEADKIRAHRKKLKDTKLI